MCGRKWRSRNIHLGDWKPLQGIAHRAINDGAASPWRSSSASVRAPSAITEPSGIAQM